MPDAIASRIVWNRVGGPINEVGVLLEVAASIGLIEVTPDGIGRCRWYPGPRAYPGR